MIAVVDVRQVKPVPGTNNRAQVVMDVREWIKPATGDRTVSVEVANPDEGWGDAILSEGLHALVQVPMKPDQPPAALTYKLERQVMRTKQYLPKAEKVACPTYGDTYGDTYGGNYGGNYGDDVPHPRPVTGPGPGASGFSMPVVGAVRVAMVEVLRL